jgi:hypothetical protein
MKAVILAAGRNEHSMGAGSACLREVDHKTVLEHQLESLVEAGIDEVAIVIGSDQDEIVRHVDSRNCPDGYVGPGVEFIQCAEPDREDSYLLGLAREWIGDDPFICLEAGTATANPLTTVSPLTPRFSGREPKHSEVTATQALRHRSSSAGSARQLPLQQTSIELSSRGELP